MSKLNARYIYRPHPGPQTQFAEFPGRYALLGGAKGPGKTTALIYDPFRQIINEAGRVERGEIDRSVGHALLLRRTMPELRDILRRVKVSFPKIDSGVKWSGDTKTYTFSCGYEYTFGHIAEDDDWTIYYGQEYTWLGFDELCMFTEEQYEQLDTCVRTDDEVLAKQLSVRAGTNPIGKGLEWVRTRFYEVAPPGTTVTLQIPTPFIHPDGRREEIIVEREQIFIPARVEDNPSIDQAQYSATLSMQSKAVRAALREGDWYAPIESWAGQFWEPSIHVCKPFAIKRDNPSKFRACRFATTWPGMASVQWFVLDQWDNATCYRSLTVTGHTAGMLAQRIKELEADAGEWDQTRDVSKLTGPLEFKCWPTPGQMGPSVAETMLRVGVYWFKADKDVSSAADQFRARLAKRSKHPTDKDKAGKPLVNVPGIRWFDTCISNVFDDKGRKRRMGPILTIPVLIADKADADLPDLKANCSDWLAASFACMSRPIAPGRDIGQGDQYEDELAQRRRYETNARPKVGRLGTYGGW
jgi:hypothetical protein